MWVPGDPFLAEKLQNISYIWGLTDHITSNILKAIFHKFYLVDAWVFFFRYTLWRHHLDMQDSIGCYRYSRFSHSCPCSWYQSMILVLSNCCNFLLLKILLCFFKRQNKWNIYKLQNFTKQIFMLYFPSKSNLIKRNKK